MVGCGTIMNTTDAENAVDAGAEFIITPVMLPDVIEWCAARNIVIVPGCQTPTVSCLLCVLCFDNDKICAHLVYIPFIMPNSHISNIYYRKWSRHTGPEHHYRNFSQV